MRCNKDLSTTINYSRRIEWCILFNLLSFRNIVDHLVMVTFLQWKLNYTVLKVSFDFSEPEITKRHRRLIMKFITLF